jgi:WD40 repeat protein
MSDKTERATPTSSNDRKKNRIWIALSAAAAAVLIAAGILTARSGLFGRGTPRAVITPFLPTAPAGTLSLPAPIVLPGAEALTDSNVASIAELAHFGRGWPAAAAYSPDGGQLALGSSLGIDIQQTATGAIQSLYGSDSPILTVQYSPDGLWIAAGREDGRVLLLDAKTGKVRLTLVAHSHPVHGLAFSRPPSAAGASAWLASGAEDGSIVVWDLTSGMARNHFLNSLLGYWGYGIRSLAFSPENAVLVTGGDQGYVSRWDLAAGVELPRWQTQHGLLFNIAFSPDGRRLATACGDGSIQIWDYATGDPLQLLLGHTYGAWSVVWSNDGSELFSGAGDGTVKIWEPDAGTLRREKTVAFTKIDSLQLSPDGSHLAAVSIGEHALLLNAGSLAEENSYPEFFGGVRSASFYPDGGSAALADENGLTYLWNVRRGNAILLGTVRPASKAAMSAVFSPRGGLLAVADGVPGLLRVYDLTTLSVRTETRIPSLRTVAVSPDGSLIAAGGSPLTLLDVPSGKSRNIDIPSSPTSLTFLTLAQTGGPYLAAGLEDGTVLVWNLADDSQTELASKRHPAIWGLASSGTVLASGDDQGDVQIWDAAAHTVLRHFTGYSGSIFAIALSPDGSILAAGGIEGSIRFWSLRTGTLLRVLPAHNGWVNGLAFSPDGRWLLSAGSDGTAHLWGIPAPVST